MATRAKLVRLLIYEGPEEWIDSCIQNRGVKGSVTPSGGDTKITELVCTKEVVYSTEGDSNDQHQT